MRVLVIPEDFTYDQYILQPLVEAMIHYLGKPRAKVVVCRDPQLGGIAQATNWEQIEQIIERYPMVNLFLLCVDRDGEAGRRERLDQIEKLAAEILPEGHALFAENAWQEIEVWVLAGHDLPGEWNWQEVRAEIHPKELYFLPFAEQKGLPLTELVQLYKALAGEAASRYSTRIRRICPEDILVLESKVQNWLSQSA